MISASPRGVSRADDTRSSLAAATVLHRPEPAQLAALLGAIEAEALRLFIFVNGPVEASVEAALARLHDARLIASPENLGLGHGLNAVTEAAADEGFAYLLLFDQDSAPSPGLGAALLSRLTAQAEGSAASVAAIGPRLVAPAGESHLAPWYSRRGGAAADDVVQVDFLPTSGTLLAIDAWRSIGPFRADYFIDGIDIEWCFRAWSAGYRCLLVDAVTMAHRWGHGDDDGRPQILRQSPQRVFYYIRNAVHGLRLPTMPLRWRVRTVLRLAAQSALLLIDQRFAAPARTLVARAVRDGWRGRLGSAQ